MTNYELIKNMNNEDELEKLQLAFDTFIKNHHGCLDHFEIDYNVVIDL